MKSLPPQACTKKGRSHPARGAWIEIFLALEIAGRMGVAPRKGCVD